MNINNSKTTKINPFIYLITKLIDVNPDEAKTTAWGWLYIFSLFLSYYVLRPVRDSLGISNGVQNLPWLFTGTMIVMLLINPIFAAAVKNWPRERFIAVTYRFFIANLLVFLMLFITQHGNAAVWVARAFFIWVSVFNLFVVSVFWSTIVDAFTQEQGKRIFGFLAAAATLGGIVGSGLTTGFISVIGQNGLLIISAVLLEIAVFAARRVSISSKKLISTADALQCSQPLGGGFFSGMTHTLRSPYLMGIAGFMLLYSVTSTFLYFQQAHIAASQFSTSTERTAFFAHIDLWVNVITLIIQIFLTGWLISTLGIIYTLVILPIISLVGFGLLASQPTIGIFALVQVSRRVANFALARPTRELLFTSISREDRYKAKNFIDTVVYRFGDQAGSWSYSGLSGLSLSISQIAIIAIPLCIIWSGLSLWLGMQQTRSQPLTENEPRY